MDYKIAFFDIDRTISHHKDGSISSKTKDAIKSLKSKGIKVVAATGRALSMCKEIEEIGVETFITANGAYVKHKQLVIHKIAINKSIVQEVVEKDMFREWNVQLASLKMKIFNFQIVLLK